MAVRCIYVIIIKHQPELVRAVHGVTLAGMKPLVLLLQHNCTLRVFK